MNSPDRDVPAPAVRAAEAVRDRIAQVFAAADVDGCLHAVDIDSGHAFGVRSDEQVVIASIVKVFVVLEFARQVEAGRLDPRERAVVGRADRLGGWGVAGCADDVEMSLRDLAYLAMSVSDNSAADVLADHVGPDVLALLARELGLDRTRIVGGPRQALQRLRAEVGARDDAEFARIFPSLPDSSVRRLSAFDPDRATSSTPRELTRLLRLIWLDRAGPAPACATVRELMSRQLFWTRLASGFPADVRVSAKTGTLPGLHMEAGVVEYPDGGRYAIAAFARAQRLTARRIDVDLAIGRAARIVVEALRGRVPG